MLFTPSNSTTGFLLQTMLYVANITKHDLDRPKTRQDFLDSPNGADSDSDSPRCYGIFGCFPITAPWTTEDRPIGNYPDSPMRINARFAVYTKHNRHMPKYVNLNETDEVKYSGVHPKGTIYVLAHGYLDSGDRPWVLDLMNALLNKERNSYSSVIIIDWSNGAAPPYAQAVANTRLVGVITAHVLNMVKEQLKMKNLDNVHMIGHSLGSHLSGYTGYYLRKEFSTMLGRITSLDPAEPLFTNSDPLVRLDQTDAKFVDVIHTDTVPFSRGGMGMPNAIGHIDFYPNGGHTNPGCNLPMQHYIQSSGSLSLGVQQFFSCNHVRSQEFFLESIKSNCSFTGVACNSYESFLAGQCTCKMGDRGFCLKMGLDALSSYNKLIGTREHSSGLPIKAYFMTGSRAPFCRATYKLSVIMSRSTESLGHGEEVGILLLEIQSRDGTKTDRIKFSKDPMNFEPEKIYTAVIPGKDIGIPESMTLDWEYRQNPLNPLTWRLVSPKVFIQHIIVESVEHHSREIMCPLYPSTPVIAGTPSAFKREYCNTFKNLHTSN